MLIIYRWMNKWMNKWVNEWIYWSWNSWVNVSWYYLIWIDNDNSVLMYKSEFIWMNV